MSARHILLSEPMKLGRNRLPGNSGKSGRRYQEQGTRRVGAISIRYPEYDRRPLVQQGDKVRSSSSSQSLDSVKLRAKGLRTL